MDVSSLGDLFIIKDQNGNYKWHNDGTGFLKEGETIVNGEYNAWGDLWNISLQTDDFDTDIYVPANFDLELYPVGASGYSVPKLSWDNNGNDEFVKYELERSLTGLFDEQDRVIYEVDETGGSNSYSHIDYFIRIHPTQNPETVYYRVKTILKPQFDSSDDLIDPVFNYTDILSTDYFIMLKPIKKGEIASPFLSTPEHFTLLPNYPNPFARFTHIPFYVPEDGEVTLTIFDLLARPIRLLHAGKLSMGEYLSGWDGKNALGYPVPSGTYFIILKNEQQRSVRKLNFIR